MSAEPAHRRLAVNLTAYNYLRITLNDDPVTPSVICTLLPEEDGTTTVFRWETPWISPSGNFEAMGVFTNDELRHMGFTEAHLTLVDAAHLGEDALRKAFEGHMDRPLSQEELEQWMFSRVLVSV